MVRSHPCRVLGMCKSSLLRWHMLLSCVGHWQCWSRYWKAGNNPWVEVDSSLTHTGQASRSTRGCCYYSDHCRDTEHRSGTPQSFRCWIRIQRSGRFRGSRAVGTSRGVGCCQRTEARSASCLAVLTLEAARLLTTGRRRTVSGWGVGIHWQPEKVALRASTFVVAFLGVRR